jgi:phage terminase large subunit
MNEVLQTGYSPRRLQAYLHANMKRFNVLVCHRRFGKTVFAINEIIDRALRNPMKDPQYGYIAPTYGQAKKVAWEYLKEYTRNFPDVKPHEQDLTVTIPRPQYGDKIKIMLLGAENYDNIRGIYLDGVVLDEFADMFPEVWGKVVRPFLTDRKGWAIFIGTPKGANHFYERYKQAKENVSGNWFCEVFKASSTGIVNAEELMALRSEMSEEEYNQEFECSFSAAMVGSYWGKQMELLETREQITKVPHDPALQVDTFWDLGVSDTTTIWFTQTFRQEVRIIDYFEMSGMGLDYYAKILREGHRKEYTYRDHNWPHDGASRDLSSGKERSTMMRELGVRVYVRPKYDVADSINAARLLLPKCWIDESKCVKGIEALKNYEREYDTKNKIFRDRPKHNWASHGADAFRLMAMCLKQDKDRIDKRNLKRYAENTWSIFRRD